MIGTTIKEVFRGVGMSRFIVRNISMDDLVCHYIPFGKLIYLGPLNNCMGYYENCIIDLL